MDLLTAYSKRSGLYEELDRALHRVMVVPAERASSVASVNSGSPAGMWRIADRFAAEDVGKIMESYRGGATAKELAREYKVGLTSIKRLIREQRARRKD